MYFGYFGFDVFILMGCICQGETLCLCVFMFLMFLVSHMVHWLLIYIMRLFMVYVFFMFCEIKKLILFTCIFHTCIYVFVECFKNLQVNSVVATVYFSN